MRQKSFERKSWYLTSIHKIFRSKKFSEKWRFLLRNFWYCWENQFSTKSWYTILCNFFNPEFFWNKRVPLQIFSVLWDEKFSRENSDIRFLYKKFFDKTAFLKTEGIPYEIFRTVRKSLFDKIVIYYLIKISIQNFPEKKVPLGFSSVLWDKNFERKSWYPLPSHKIFR